jgi:cytochrome bd-type quinol oxidase subunit 2
MTTIKIKTLSTAVAFFVAVAPVTLLSALYLPLIVMLAALIFRGLAFEFRYKSHGLRRFWDVGFAGGSFLASFIQGTSVGALVEGLAIQDGRYVGGPFGWISPFALLCGLGLCLGYCLLGAGWLTYRTAEDVQLFAFRLLPRLMVAVFVFLAVVFVTALALDLRVMHRWLEQPKLALFPVFGAVACCILFVAVRKRYPLVPFLCGLTLFAAAFGTLTVSFYPYIGAVLDHDPGSRSSSAASESCISVLGRRRVRASGHPGLYARCLLYLQRESRPGCRIPLTLLRHLIRRVCIQHLLSPAEFSICFLASLSR